MQGHRIKKYFWCIVLVLSLHRRCLSHCVEILNPISCKDYSLEKPIHIKVWALPQGVNQDSFINQLSTSLLRLEITVKSSKELEVWDFDVPPVPHASLTKYVACPGETSVYKPESTFGGEVTRTGLLGPGIVCKQLGWKNWNLFHRDSRRKGFLWEVDVPLGKGVHEVTTKLQNTTSGGCMGIDSISISVGSQFDPAESRRFHDHLSAKHVEIGKEQAYLSNSRKCVFDKYKILHKDIRDPALLDQFIDPKLWKALRSGNGANIIEIAHREAPGVYSMLVFTPMFCKMLMEEIKHANKQSIMFTRPNTMNNYGIVLEEIGLQSWLDHFLKTVLNPLSAVLFEEWGGGSLDSHHSFTLRYRVGEDEHLDRHMDLSEITLNVCLGGEFDGAELYFNGARDHSDENHELGLLSHRPGVGILHVGQQFHGVHKLTKGERHNMVIWGRSSKFRSSAAEVYSAVCMPHNIRNIKQNGMSHVSGAFADEL